MRTLRTWLTAAAFGAALIGVGPADAQEISGAGSTFAYPILTRWSQAFQKAQSDPEFQAVAATLDYEPVGSQAGVMRLKESGVDFAVTELPLGAEELARYRFAQVPIVIGGIVVAVNLPGVPTGRLQLTGEILADIYLGRIRNWADPKIRELNADLTLPDAPIAVLRRADGSGTTFNFTNYLGRQNADWKGRIGEGLSVSWPVGTAAKGNDGMAARVAAMPNSIGYLDYGQATRARLSLARLRNRAGLFVSPSVDAFRASAAGADWAAASDFGLLLNDAPGAQAYPIVATAFAVLRRDASPSRGTRATVAFLRWSLESGAAAAIELGYVPLPSNLAARVEQSLSDVSAVRR